MNFEERLKKKAFAFLEASYKAEEYDKINPIHLASEVKLDKVTSEKYLVEFVNSKHDLQLTTTLLSRDRLVLYSDILAVGEIARMSVSKQRK